MNLDDNTSLGTPTPSATEEGSLASPVSSASEALGDALIVILLDAGLIGFASLIAGKDRAYMFFSITTVIRFAVILPLTFILAKRLWGHTHTQLGVRLPNKSQWWWATKISLISLLGYIAIGAFVLFVIKPSANQLIISSNYWFREMNIFYIVAALIQAPIVEEIVFRGMLHNAMGTRFSMPKRIVISAVVFAIAHMLWLGVIFFPVTQLMGGFIFAWSYERTRSIYPGIFLHAFGNGMVCLYNYVNTVYPDIIRGLLG